MRITEKLKNRCVNGFVFVSRIISEVTNKLDMGGRIMKRLFTGIVVMGLVLFMGSVTAFAAEPGKGRYFVDTDGDGICDNAGSMCIYEDSDGDGICDVCGTNNLSCLTGDGTDFADADGDGICDNCGTYHWCDIAGAGGSNFVDADNDGVCDNYAAGQGRGNGPRCGSGRRGNGFRGRCGR